MIKIVKKICTKVCQSREIATPTAKIILQKSTVVIFVKYHLEIEHSLVRCDLAVEYFNGLVGLSQIDLAVVPQISVVVQGGDSSPVVTNDGPFQCEPGKRPGDDFRPVQGVDVVGVDVAVARQVGTVDGGQQHHHVAQGGPPGPELHRDGVARADGRERHQVTGHVPHLRHTGETQQNCQRDFSSNCNMLDYSTWSITKDVCVGLPCYF